MIHLSGANSSIIFDQDGDTLNIIHWGVRLNNVVDGALGRATKNPHFHGGLDVSPRNLILREHSRKTHHTRGSSKILAKPAR